MPNNIKDKTKVLIKKALGKNPIIRSKTTPENYSIALKEFAETHQEILDTHRYLSPRKDRKPYNKPLEEMEPAFNFFSSDIYKFGNDEIEDIFEYDSLHSGTPMRYKAFPECLKAARKSLRAKNLYWYPSSSGTLEGRQKFVDYLVREGFQLEPSDNYDGLGVDNVTFTCSTTHAYFLILNSICREEDVILMTGPNYGLFGIMTELDNFHTEILDLKEEDDWYVNKEDLAKKIDEINKELKKKYKDKLDYTPKVAAFLNLNPHNPLGKVMNHKNKEILEGIGNICLEKGVFVIDDLIYRDLTYDQTDLALPMASIPKYFNNTISLFGLSKSFGLASLRAAVVVAPAPICSSIADQVYHTMDSIPVLQVAAVSGAYNGSNKRYRKFNKYMNHLIQEYIYRYNLMTALVYGIKTVKDEKLRYKIFCDIQKYEKDENNQMLLFKGCPNLKIRKGTIPESGFFVVFDFTELKGKKDGDKIIKTDIDMLKYFYSKAKIKYLMGSNMFWPNKDEIVGRISFGLDKKAIVHNMLLMNKAIRELK